MGEMEIRQPKQIALRVGETTVFSTQNIENCVKAGMTEYLRADIPAAQISYLIERVAACELALEHQRHYCSNGLTHHSVMEYRRKYNNHAKDKP